MVKNPANGSASTNICAAHVHEDGTAPASCGSYVELSIGDELYIQGFGVGEAYSPSGYRFVTFQCHLIYKADVLN